MPDDQQLIKEILNGSEAAMEVMTRRYYNTVFAYVYRKVQHKETACDLTQEIFIKIIQRIHTYKGQAEFSNWIYTVALNHCRDYWKSKDYKQQTNLNRLNNSLSSEHSNVTYIFEAKESREQIKRMIECLPLYQQEAIILKYFHDRKIKDIAVITKTNESTVKSRLKQGLEKISAMLKKEETGDEQARRRK